METGWEQNRLGNQQMNEHYKRISIIAIILAVIALIISLLTMSYILYIRHQVMELFNSFSDSFGIEVSQDADIDTSSSDTITNESPDDLNNVTSSLEELSVVGDEGNLGDYYVKINDYTLCLDYDGNATIVIHYDFTNNSNDAVSALWAVSEKAYQDGVELENALVFDDNKYDASISQTEVKPGVTMNDCQVAYVLKSTSPVEFEMSELVSLSNTKLEKTFEIR